LKRNNKPLVDAMLPIQLHKFALKNNLSFTIDSEKAYYLLRKFITGGIANVLQKAVTAGNTRINRLAIHNKIIESRRNIHVVTHIVAFDANSLYPSATCSKKHPLIPYTDGKMYMPARLVGYYSTKNGSCESSTAESHSAASVKSEKAKEKILSIISNRNAKTLFVASVKGSIRATDTERQFGVDTEFGRLYGDEADEYYMNKCINFAPILRNFGITINELTLGKTTYAQIEKAAEFGKEIDKKKTLTESKKPTEMQHASGQTLNGSR
jgi:hypothetical protein